MATVIDFTAYRNQKAASAKVEKRETERAEKINDILLEAREAVAVGDARKALAKVAEAADVQTKQEAWMPAYCDPRNEHKGSKYDATKGKSVGDLPALMRQDIKDATARGQLPKGLKVSVRKEPCTHMWSIRIQITGLPIGTKVYNPEYLRFTGNLQHPPKYPENWTCAGEQAPLCHIEGGEYSKEVQGYLDVLTDIYNAYQRDNSDSMSDYFDVRYYGGVSIQCGLGENEIYQEVKE